MSRLTVLIALLMIAAVMAGYGASPSNLSEPAAAVSVANNSLGFFS